MFDLGDLKVLTLGNSVLKTGVITWPLKLYARFNVFKEKKQEFLSCWTRSVEH